MPHLTVDLRFREPIKILGFRFGGGGVKKSALQAVSISKTYRKWQNFRSLPFCWHGPTAGRYKLYENIEF